ncbi:MAG: hypothetical protein F6K65_04465 [Moorea sp. SIO3C2]|nr:hypothetical protein [Moorena sp. SIO3C2]
MTEERYSVCHSYEVDRIFLLLPLTSFPLQGAVGVGSDSRFPIPDSRFPIPDSLLPAPYSLLPIP